MKKIYKREFERNDKRHLLLFGYEEHKEMAPEEISKPAFMSQICMKKMELQLEIIFMLVI